MSVRFVVDSNCIKIYQDERISEQTGIGSAAVDHIFAQGIIVLDEQGKCLDEWISCARGPEKLNLNDWVSEQLVNGKIELFKTAPDQNLRKALDGFGLPKKDHKWFYVGVAAKACALVSEDSDLFHPPSKLWPAAKKEELKEKRNGCLCKFARKFLKFEVIRLAHVHLF